eukprot:356747-Chlamydomonas_euryale.AAC.5
MSTARRGGMPTCAAKKRFCPIAEVGPSSETRGRTFQKSASTIWPGHSPGCAYNLREREAVGGQLAGAVPRHRHRVCDGGHAGRCQHAGRAQPPQPGGGSFGRGRRTEA